jgi:hypothetical protein
MQKMKDGILFIDDSESLLIAYRKLHKDNLTTFRTAADFQDVGS